MRCGPVPQPDGSVRWRVWAPRADTVELVLFEDHGRRGIPLRLAQGQIWLVLAGGAIGARPLSRG